MSTSHYYPQLPKLKPSPHINPSEAGTWVTGDTNLLTNLISSIQISNTIAEAGDINSIPDMWARPLLFEMALLDNEKVQDRHFVEGLQKRIEGEWRGLLAVLALKDVKRFELTATEFNVANQKDSFASALSKIMPAHFISTDTTWNPLYVISYRGVPIGMTAPTTLVCTAVNCFKRLSRIDWSDGTYLKDPTPFLNKTEKEMLACWLRKLELSLRNHPCIVDRNSREYNRILDCIDTFVMDLVGSEEAIYAISTGDLNMTEGIFKYLDTRVELPPATVADSHVHLLRSRPGNKEILLVADDMGKRWGVEPQDLVVWPGISMTNLAFGGKEIAKTSISVNSGINVEIRNPNDFFLDKMVAAEIGDAFPGAEEISGSGRMQRFQSPITPFIPIKKELLEYLSSRDILDRISFQDKQDGIIVRFRFPLSGAKGSGQDYIFEKEYRKDQIVGISSLPVVEIWPNFKSPKWNRYYIYYKNASGSRTDLYRNAFFAEPWAQNASTTNIPGGGLSNRYIGYISSFPEALVCSANVSSEQGGRGEIVEAGVLLLKQPETPSNAMKRHWNIGVDFGTSGTMVYRKEGTQTPVPLSFVPRLFPVTLSMDLRTNLYLDFLPVDFEGGSKQTDGSFLSIFQLFDQHGEGKPQISPLLDGHIYLLKDYDDFSKKAANIITNLKWGVTENDRINASVYLEQVILQCSAEAVANGVTSAEWQFSYPTAFSNRDKETYRERCSRVVDACNAISGIEHVHDTGLNTESVATALYFATQPTYLATFARGAVCLDIGSGTSDISIWQGEDSRLLYQTSVRFAGRQLFSPIARKVKNTSIPLIIEALSEQQKKVLLGMDGEDRLNTFLDSVLRTSGDLLLERLPNKTGGDAANVLQVMSIGLSGLFYYVGMLLKYLHDSGLYQGTVMPNIYVGGNGSRIFHWVAGGRYHPNHPINNLLRNVITAAAGFEPEGFDITLSRVPKAEVAYGLVNEKAGFSYNETDSLKKQYVGYENEDLYLLKPVVAGEAFSQNGTDKQWNSFLTARDIKNGVRINEIDQFKAFVGAFNTYSSDAWTGKINISGPLFKTIKDQVVQSYANGKGAKEEDIRVEPIFVSALSQFMERYKHE